MRADRFFLAPYWWTLKLRHLLYDRGWKKVQRSPIPALCIGNLAVGGTGKTPFTEMLLRHFSATDAVPTHAADSLANEMASSGAVAVLSKGYGRKSSGFLYVQANGTPEEFGDEPLQIKRKFPQVPVAVCSDRIEGCRRLAEDGFKRILLDDAFQFRALQADCSVVLVEYGRPLSKDHLLPLGRLRDLPERISRADIIIASKCPDDVTAEERSAWIRTLGLPQAYDATARAGITTGTPVFFTTLAYAEPEAVFPEGDRHFLYSQKMIVITGIANDKPMVAHLSGRYRSVSHLHYPDHHVFTPTDLRAIEYAAGKCPEAILITTEKDKERLLPLREKFSEDVRKRLFCLPIRTEFLTPEEGDRFFQMLEKFPA